MEILSITSLFLGFELLLNIQPHAPPRNKHAIVYINRDSYSLLGKVLSIKGNENTSTFIPISSKEMYC